MRLILLGLLTSFLAAQVPAKWEIKADPPNPKAGEPVILEVVGLNPGPGLSLDWDNDKGSGEWDTKSGKKVRFRPTKSGEVVTIVCVMSGGLNQKIVYELKVTGDRDPAAGQPQAAPPPPQVITPTQPAVSHQSQPLPADAVPLDAIVAPNEAYVAATGWMGDAMVSNAVSLVGALQCKFDVNCLSLVYDPANRKEGFVSFAWQVVPQGQRWNWGEHKGVDLSGKGFKSVRVSAKADPAYGVLPKVEFLTGGNINPQFATMHPTSSLVSTGLQALGPTWKELCLDVTHISLKDVVSPLTISVSTQRNPLAKMGIFIDGVYFSKRPCGQ